MYSVPEASFTDSAIDALINRLPSHALSSPEMHSLARGPSRASFEPVSRSFAVRILERAG